MQEDAPPTAPEANPAVQMEAAANTEPTTTNPPKNQNPFLEQDGSIDFTKYSITLSIGGLYLFIKLLGLLGVIDTAD